MFVRRKRNRSGTISVQLVQKVSGKFQVLERIGIASNNSELNKLILQANTRLLERAGQLSLPLVFQRDEDFLGMVKNSLGKIRSVGLDLVLGKIYDQIGYDQITDNLFRYLVLSRLLWPGSKLRTVDYLLHYCGVVTTVDRIYRYMDKFNQKQKSLAIDITVQHTTEVLGGEIVIAFFDVTTLYFEASEEDDLRRIGFSKDGKAQNPQILLCLLVGMEGYPLAYEVFEGNRFEGHTMIPVVETFKSRYKIQSLTIVADAGLLSHKNIEELKSKSYPFILGGRIKNESEVIQSQIFAKNYNDQTIHSFERQDGTKLLVGYNSKRAKKDEHLRRKGLRRLEQDLKNNKMSKRQINDRGYNKYLKIKNEIKVEIDYQAFKADEKWNGLKGYVTNTNLTNQQVIEQYHQLWHIEKAFRISKTDLRIRPIFHYRERRIRTHICIAFCAYKIYKELERQLKLRKVELSVEAALLHLKTIYQTSITLPISRKTENIFLPMIPIQQSLLKAFDIKN